MARFVSSRGFLTLVALFALAHAADAITLSIPAAHETVHRVRPDVASLQQGQGLALPPAEVTSIGTTTFYPHIGEPFALTISESWNTGCVPHFNSVSVSGKTIRIDATANPTCLACPQIVTPYQFTTTPITLSVTGDYTVNYYVTYCTTTSLKEQAVITATVACTNGFALSIQPSTVSVGQDFVLSWCDPSYFQSGDNALGISSYTIYYALSPSGPFVSAGTVDASFNAVKFTAEPSDAGLTYYFYVQASGGRETVAGPVDATLTTQTVPVHITGNNTTCSACTPGPNTACLLGNRFRVTLDWTNFFANPPFSGKGHPIAYAENLPDVDPVLGPLSEVAYFSMYDWAPTAVESIVRMIKGVNINNMYWVYVTGFSNNQYTVTVTDTRTCATWTRTNPSGTFPIITDLSAFPLP